MEEPEIDRRSLEASMKDVAAYGQMVGFGEAYFGAYAVSMGASNWLVGILGTVPPFAGACVQPAAARAVARTGRRRRFYMAGAILQTVTLVPICASAFLPREAAYPVLLVSTILYFAGVHFATPAWNSLMGDLVPAEWRGRYFGARNTVMVVAQCLATLLAGAGLEIYTRAGHERWGFALVFAAALAARAVSVWHLGRMREPEGAVPSRAPTADAARTSNFGRFALFVAGINFSVAVSGPYFVPYMLHDLRFTYFEFMVSQVVVVIAQVLVLRRWGALGDRFGNRRILLFTAFGITGVPLLWIAARGPLGVWLVQAAAGIAWGGFNLAAGNFLLDALPREERAAGVARLNVLAGLGILCGGLAGAAIVDQLPQRYAVAGVTVTFFSSLHVIMLVSALLRAATLTVFLRRFREVRDVPNVGVAEILLRSTAVKSITDVAADFVTWYRREKNS